MKSIAIIAEFNPFHTGHAHLISQVRQAAGPDAAIVIIMSGAFVQRGGEPAFFDKWHRAVWAIKGGADVVIELPAVYALSSAAGFATGGVTLASRLGCQGLACGVENGTAEDFLALARCAHSLPDREKEGPKETAGREQTEYLLAASPKKGRLLEQPNALLAFEYAKALLNQDRPLAFWPFPRQGHHGDTELGPAFASATALRQAMRDSGAAACRPYLPSASLTDVEDQLAQGAFTDDNRYGDFIASQNRLLTPDQLRCLPAFTEGLENRWHRAFMENGSYAQALKAIKTRRYAYSRLCRMGAYTLLQPSQDLMDRSYEAGPQYARLLALNGRGAAFLKGVKGQLPVVTRVRSDAPGLSPLGQEQLKLDLKASDIQSFCFSKEGQRKGHQDYYHSPLFLPI